MENRLSYLQAFLVDYCRRHAHPVNALLHIVGVPMAFIGLYFALTGHFGEGLGFLVIGYALQYFGHKAQGNEVGEVTLIRHLWKRIRQDR